MILIVDDKQENLISLKKVLVKHGFEVDTASSGEEALRKVLKNSYVLIILDVQMPGMDGFEVADAISGYSKAKETAIIFLSAASTENQFITRGYSSGGLDYITKPVEMNILLLKVKTFYRIYEQSRKLKDMQEALLLEIETRKKAESKKDEFISIASHELKTPLTSIKGYLQLVDRNLNVTNLEKSRHHLKKVHKQVDRLNDLVTDLLDISRIESGEMRFKMDTFHVPEMVRNVVEVVQQGNPSLKIAVEGKIHSPVFGDESRLEQVLMNFLTNAIKYGETSREILVTMKENDQEVYLGVRDYGIGISQQHIQNIFKKFYRVEETSLRFQGLGIGLYICKEIVETHGGCIGVHSTPGEGSEFYFSLPIKINQEYEQNTKG